MRKSGFTLIELSITLVIIGLLVAGVLVGKDLIKAAEIRAQISEIEKINQSILTFSLKYDCLPGDCKIATNFFGASSQPEKVSNGNGDGMIQGYSTAPSHNLHVSDAEMKSVFDQLTAAGLHSLPQYDEEGNGWITPGVGYPLLKFQSVGELFNLVDQSSSQGGVVVGYTTGVSYLPSGHKTILGACRTNDLVWGPNFFGFGCGINPDEAFAIDSKIDDGKPMSGSTVITSHAYYYRIPGWVGELGDYNEIYCTSPLLAVNRYVTSTQRACVVNIKAPF